jgi:hypothetical protein
MPRITPRTALSENVADLQRRTRHAARDYEQRSRAASQLVRNGTNLTNDPLRAAATVIKDGSLYSAGSRLRQPMKI